MNRATVTWRSGLAILGILAALPAWSARFKKGPYLIYKNVNTSMAVLWQTDAQPATSTIEWGTTPVYGNGPYTVTPYGDNQFEYDINALAPGTLYYYRVVVDGSEQKSQFRSAPAASAGRVVLYGYGDSRTNPYVHNKVVRRLLEDVGDAPDQRRALVIDSADLNSQGLVEGDWQDQHFNRSYPWMTRFQSEFPFMTARGNHEDTGSLLRKYYPYAYVDPSAFYYSFDYGPVHVTVIDDNVNRAPASSQYNWIDADLSGTTKPWKIVVFHKPAWGSGGYHSNDSNNQTLTSNLFEPRGVALAFTGHNHYYARNAKSGIPHITSGGGGAPLYTPDPSYPYYVTSANSHHYSRIAIKDNTLHFTAFDWGGRVIDNFFLRRGTDSGAPGVDAVRAPADGRTVKVMFDECVEAGTGVHGAENIANYVMPGFTVVGAAIEDTRDTVRLSVLPRMAPARVYQLTVQGIDDCAWQTNAMPAAQSRDFSFVEGPGVVVEQGDPWRYFKGLSDPAVDWASRGYNDAGWTEGPTGIGYGGNDDATVLSTMSGNYSTVFLRRTFDVCDALAVTAMALSVSYDDGFAAYVNGVKVAGRNDQNFTGHNHTALASAIHEAGSWERFDVSPSVGAIRGGENVLAFVLLNASLTDSDATLVPELELKGGYCTDTARPPEVAAVGSGSGSLAWPDKKTLTWPVEPSATGGYALYRGERTDLPRLADASIDSCLRLRTLHNDENAASNLDDDPSAVPSRMYWYLVTAINSFGEGSAGTRTAGPRILNSSGGCPLP